MKTEATLCQQRHSRGLANAGEGTGDTGPCTAQGSADGHERPLVAQGQLQCSC